MPNERRRGGELDARVERDFETHFRTTRATDYPIRTNNSPLSPVFRPLTDRICGVEERLRKDVSIQAFSAEYRDECKSGCARYILHDTPH